MPGEFKMINGEKTCEPSPEVVSPDPLDRVLPSLQSQNSDNGEESPVYSQYSSCGDSEFERYCSANSVMGTPSLCSSVGTFQEYSDLDFGSLRSSTFGDSGSLENFRLESEFTRNVGESSITSSSGSGCLSGHRNEDFEGKNGFEVRNDVVGQVAVGINDGFDSYRNMEHSSCNEFSNGNTRTVSPKLSTITDEEPCVEADCGGVVRLGDCDDLAMMHTMHSTKGVELESHLQTDAQQVESCLDELHTHSDVEFEEGGRCLNENDNSLRFEHSEGEDSMFGCGTDDDQKLELLPPKSMQDHHEAKAEKGKSLLMSSCIAFGSDDWEDFEHETKQYDMTSFMSEKRHPNTEHEEIVTSSLSQTTAFPVLNPKQGEVEDISLSSNQLQGAGELFYGYSSLTPVDILDCGETKLGKDTKYMVGAKNGNGELDESADYLENQTKSDILPRDQILLSQKLPSKKVLNFMGDNFGESRGLLSSQEFGNNDGNRVSECQELGQSTIQLDPLFDFTSSQFYSAPTEAFEAQTVDVLGEASKSLALDKNFVKKPMKDFPASFDLFEARPKAIKTENVELFDFCNEVVHEMEEILLDSAESSGAMFTQCDMPSQARSPLPLRDGGSTASTSGTDDTFSLNQQSQRIDGIEVIGAKQKKGDVSFSERLVGVKEYTVYVMRVWSGKDNWEIERRYRDFCTLHRRLKSLFSSQGWILPSPWSSVERESRKFFGNVSPDVVAERSALIQECLQSILHYQFPTSLPIALIWFLSPQKILPSSPSSNTPHSQSPVSGRGTDTYRVLTFGKTISLIVEIRPHKSTKQILEGQHYSCAGCHKHFDDGKTKVLEFVQTLGWGKPRLCEYTGQLFCSSCHTNETAVLPARVLHHWDFTLYPVSQLAKSYLDSIYDKPMLCVSAVNPFLFSKVPALQQVTGVRKRIGAMLPYVRCPFRMSIYKGLASRRYLLESNDFFALRDLIDLSKGAFAALPVMVDTVSRRILEHITEQCLVCCDVGIPCNARQACNDPSALIFPFQGAEIERCRSCKSVFHKLCFRKITICPCGVSLDPDREKGGSANASNRVSSELSSTLNLFGRKSNSKSSMGFLSGLFTKAKQEKLWGPKDGDTVISMGSLPSTSL